MKTYIREVVAALVAGSVITVSFAQAPSAPPASEPAARTMPTFVDEPIASSSGGTGPNAEVANAIVQALLADPSLKGSKITVQPEANGILLTGVTPTLKSQNKLLQIATQHAGEGNVVSIVNSEEVFIDSAASVRPAA